jgi:hypothetical protein
MFSEIMQNEIGSEFCEYSYSKKLTTQLPNWLNWGQENRFLSSGRTALDHIICDIKATSTFKSVYMPSYCCHTMIEPFTSNGVNVLFYDVVIDENEGLNYNIDYNVNCDVVFIMSYFGFTTNDLIEIIEIFKNKKGKIIVEDATHSLIQNQAFNPNSDYVFASFRKWMAIPGGSLASKINAEFYIDEPTKIHNSYVNLRVEGMKLKQKYMNSFITDKKAFMQIFNEAESLLDRDYKGYAIDDLSFSIIAQIDKMQIVSKRKANATHLIEGITENANIKPVFKRVTANDCPLFVPIIIKTAFRDKLKKYLIENKIYCPVHWPKSDLHKLNPKSEFIYDHILSIICDHRYDLEVMDRIVEVLISSKLVVGC